jgi:hypothetical protein
VCGNLLLGVEESWVTSRLDHIPACKRYAAAPLEKGLATTVRQGRHRGGGLLGARVGYLLAEGFRDRDRGEAIGGAT